MSLEAASAYLAGVEAANRQEIIPVREGLQRQPEEGIAIHGRPGGRRGHGYLDAATDYHHDMSSRPSWRSSSLAADAVVAADCADELKATLSYLRTQTSGIETCGPAPAVTFSFGAVDGDNLGVGQPAAAEDVERAAGR